MPQQCARSEYLVGEAQILRALGHPTRLELLEALHQGELSPSQFARRRREPVSNVTYHFRLLEKMGWIELVRTTPVGGSVEHFYRRIERVLASWRPAILDEGGWIETKEAMRVASEAIASAEARAGERLRNSGEEGAIVITSLLGVPSPVQISALA